MQEAFSIRHTFSEPEATAQFAAALAPLLGAGDTILLEGEIGAGKSHFARALIQARLKSAGRTEDVPSPTFTLVQAYDDNTCEIWHTDLYRLTNITDIDELGLWQAFESAICLVEWPDRLGSNAPEGALFLSLKQSPSLNERHAHFHSDNMHWKSRLLQAGASDA